MSEVLTEKPFDTADPVDTTTVESTTTLTNERGSGEAHLADGTLLEEMKKAVKQSAFAFCFFVIGQANLVRLARSFFFWVSLSKKVEFYFADANLPYDKCTIFLGSLSSFYAKWAVSLQVYVDLIHERSRALDSDSDCCILQTDAPV